MNEREAFDAFAAKWRARWPEWSVAEAFVPRQQRTVAVAWFALLQELADAAWGGNDPTPGLAKLAWWQEELRGWAKGARRHPLGEALQPLPAPWDAMARQLPVLRDRELVRRDAHAVREALQRFAEAVGAIESALFGSGVTDTDAISAAFVAEAIALHGRTSLAGELLPPSAMRTARTPRARRLLVALVQARLRAMRGGGAWRPASRWRTVWTAWRAARN